MRLPQLPTVEISTGRLVTGHAEGAHAAVLAALARPNEVTCLAPISISFLRPEDSADIGHFTNFFGADASYVHPAFTALMSRPLHMFHADRNTINLAHMNVLIRVGSRDSAGHLWASKRLYRLVSDAIQVGLTKPTATMQPKNDSRDARYEYMGRWLTSSLKSRVRLDVVRSQGHWWDSTVYVGDGGALNDASMRSFYAQCLHRSLSDIKMVHVDYVAHPHMDSGAAAIDVDDKDAAETGNNNIDIEQSDLNLPAPNHICRSDEFTLSLSDPTDSSGLCGFRVLQQFHSLLQSEIFVSQHHLSRSALIAHAIREVNHQHKSRSGGVAYIDNLNLRDEDVSYFDTAVAYAAEATVGGSHLHRGGSTMKGRFSSGSVDMPASGGSTGVVGGAGAGPGGGRNGMVLDDEAMGSGIKRSVRQRILNHPEMQGLFTLPAHVRAGRLCIVRTQNVRRLGLDRLLENACRNTDFMHLPLLLIVDGRIIKREDFSRDPPLKGVLFEESVGQVDICWTSNGSISASMCSRPQDPLGEKVLETVGRGVRALEGRAVVVVFGTPSRLERRHALRDLALYIANSLAAANGATVHMLSDFEYRDILSGESASIALSGFENVVFIGGPGDNKAIRDITEGLLPGVMMGSRLPVVFLPSGQGFLIGPYRFDEADQGVSFTLPLVRSVDSSVPAPPQYASDKFHKRSVLPVQPISGLCLTANSLSGYLHLSRLMWGNSKLSSGGMFGSTLPDFVVTSAEVWPLGLAGGSPLSGYWNSTWGFDKDHAYSRP